MRTARILLLVVLSVSACRSVGVTAPVETAARDVGVASGRDVEPADPAGPHRNTISWTTATEQDNFGFDIYRAPRADGPFARLNEEPVEGAGTTDEPQSYSWVDDTIDPHETYYYYVESISMSGDRERFTPIGEAPPKIPPVESRPPGR